MDGLFSSPEKSTRKMNGANGRGNSTLSSDEMDIGDSRSFGSFNVKFEASSNTWIIRHCS